MQPRQVLYPFVLGFAFLVGSVFLITERPVSTFDAKQHYYRTVQLANGVLRPIALGPNTLGGRLPRRAVDFSEQRSPTGDPDELVKVAFTNTAVYSPVNYLPQAVGHRLGDAMGLGALGSYRVSVVANLVCFLILVGLATALAPDGSLPLAAMAVGPALLRQAASQSPDALNFALVAVLAASITRTEVTNHALSGGRAVVLALIFVLVALLKPTAGVFLLLLGILPSTAFTTRSLHIGFVAGVALSGSVASLVWNRPYLGIDIAAWFGITADPVAQRQVLLDRPAVWLEALAREGAPPSLLAYWSQHHSFILWPLEESYFHATYRVNPPALAALALATLLAVTAPSSPTFRARMCFACAAAASFVATTFVIWLAFTPVGSSAIIWNQGRYFGTSFLLLFLAMPALSLFVPLERLNGRGWWRVRLGLIVAAVGLTAWTLAAVLRLSRV